MEAQNKFRCPSIVDIHEYYLDLRRGCFYMVEHGEPMETDMEPRFMVDCHDLNLAPNSWYHLVLPPLKTSEHSSPTIFARHVCLSFSAKSLILKAGPSDSIVNLDGFTL